MRLKEELIQEYRTYQTGAPGGIMEAPTAREEAGRCLACSEPADEFTRVAPSEWGHGGYWTDVAALINEAIKGEPTFADGINRLFALNDLYDACVEMLAALATNSESVVEKARDAMAAAVGKARGVEAATADKEGAVR